MNKIKPFIIPKALVFNAYKAVKANSGAAGIDQQTLDDFDRELKDNLYQLWNRLSSGSYFPPPVKAVSIAKKDGGERVLGIPTVSDRIAQMVVKMVFEPLVEPSFYPDSYGYRPNKSALEAVGITRQRCWKYNWVVEFDIKGLFDNIDHTLLMKAVRKHTQEKWIILYIERWLKAPMQLADGTLLARDKGTPQGGIISPVLSNLFLHYAFDVWMSRHHSTQPWCRYADDGLIHCWTEQSAIQILDALAERLTACKLELHSTKTKIVYCKDGTRKGQYATTEFTFLGYTFRRRLTFNSKRQSIFVNFTPAVSHEAQKAMQAKVRSWKLRPRSDLKIEDIATLVNPVLRGWIIYYGAYHRSALSPVLRQFNKILVAWAMRKYKKLKAHKIRACIFIGQIAQRQPQLFEHWKRGMIAALA